MILAARIFVAIICLVLAAMSGILFAKNATVEASIMLALALVTVVLLASTWVKEKP